MKPGLVSTIIPVYNRPKMLLEAVNSVLQQTYESIEIIIVDDGSNDDTLMTAQELAANHHRISYLSIPNSGPGPAREKGRELAKGEFIQYLDSDDLLHPDKFKIQVNSLNENPECGVAYCRQLLCDMYGNVIDHAWMRSDEQHEYMFPAMLAGRLWGTPVPLYRTTLLKTCGPWRNLKSEEDWEYDCRVASKGVQLQYSAQPLVTIRSHESGHFGKEQIGKIEKTRDRANAYKAIYKHARVAGITNQISEMERFTRMVFALCRKCGGLGLLSESRMLFKIAMEAANNHTIKIQLTVYKVGAFLLGWDTMGRISAKLDTLRS